VLLGIRDEDGSVFAAKVYANPNQCRRAWSYVTGEADIDDEEDA
jgi:hypothetical protein